eukprot:15446532-Alexandrium_andersonii.AAC.1
MQGTPLRTAERPSEKAALSNAEQSWGASGGIESFGPGPADPRATPSAELRQPGGSAPELGGSGPSDAGRPAHMPRPPA